MLVYLIFVHRLHRLLSEYPPRDCIIFERCDLPTPPLPKLVDRTCHYTTNYHKLDVNLLSYQLQSNESGIFLDADTDEPIAIVIRDFTKDYFKWKLVNEILNCIIISFKYFQMHTIH